MISCPLIAIFHVRNYQIPEQHKFQSSLSISPHSDHELTLGAPYTELTKCCMHRVLHTLSTASTNGHIHRESHTPSTPYSEHCVPRVLHTQSTASSQSWLPPASSQSLICHHSPLGRPCCTQLSTFPQLGVNQWIYSLLPSYLTPNPPPPEWSPASTPISFHHGLQLHVQTCPVMASKFSRSWLPGASATIFDHERHVHR